MLMTKFNEKLKNKKLKFINCLQIIVCLLLRVPGKDWAEED